MKIKKIIPIIFMIISCIHNQNHDKQINNKISYKNLKTIEKWNKLILEASKKYKIDIKLIISLIKIESNGNPCAISKSNAIGLMQIKPSTAGKEVYRNRKIEGQPSKNKLKDPKTNIDIGANYIYLLQYKMLNKIKNKKILRYAIIVSYVGGISILLKIFSNKQKTSMKIINKISPNKFLWYIKTKHPYKQTYKYLIKVNDLYCNIYNKQN
ncbi:transglycosylase SLT domain-containing protein [Candidatus Purcelliella pentastirinorum]|uniref:peptidoglycan lytic exotransglycosylase n=1 Tax=Candidatus Purcelliella pentastirinorum TaxID=472834 RepID=A0AAX3NAC1_9ENTR|nr:transglycosylase SLT domain-containing protein [Candidatus Purcelliella pentastirinorum]WDI78410.1 transglycosylase SLT domain-containing protein [Candidatus Purcelliella pentastirinorum]WDR80561.1 transglycosylase SLT domain-containing protein [Candidatus Purcelliella pentastirinorum]